MKKRDGATSKYFLIFILCSLAVLSFLIVRPFFVDIFMAFLFSYTFSPLYRFILRRINNKNLSAGVVSVLAFLLIAVPSVLLINRLLSELSGSYAVVQQFIEQSYTGVGCKDDGKIACTIYSLISKVMYTQPFNKISLEMISNFTSFITQNIASLIKIIPGVAFHLFIIFFTMFFFLRDAEEIYKSIWDTLMIKESHKKEAAKRVITTLNGVIYGNIVIAVVQGALAAFGFYLFGVKAALIWGFFTVIAALIPFMGAVAIWLPISAYHVIKGISMDNIAMLKNGIFIFAYGAIIVSTIDNLLRPKIVGSKIKTHPLIVMFGTVGGIMFFGVVGVFIGPVVLALFSTFLKIYKDEYWQGEAE
ncbi:MAG: AI-2E family transporter [Candidatus Woesearchaeota archaeon]